MHKHFEILSKEIFIDTGSEKKMFPGVFNECVFVYFKSVTASETPAGRNRLHYSVESGLQDEGIKAKAVTAEG